MKISNDCLNIAMEILETQKKNNKIQVFCVRGTSGRIFILLKDRNLIQQ